MKLSGLLERFSRLALPANGSGAVARMPFPDAYRACVEDLLLDHDLRTIVDCGCGEFAFPHLMHFQNVRYVGLDADPWVISFNAERHRAPTIRFRCANIFDMAFPGADLLLCRDVLDHLPNAEILGFLEQLPKFRWALFTYYRGPNEERPEDYPEEGCLYAPLDLLAPPFSLPGTVVLEGDGNRVAVLVQGGGLGARLEFERLFQGEAAPAVPAEIAPVPAQPLVLVAFKGGEAQGLQACLGGLESLEYPKEALCLHVQTQGRCSEALEAWLHRARQDYAWVGVDDRSGGGWHRSLDAALEWGCAYCFLVEAGDRLLPGTLRDLVALDLPMVAPFLDTLGGFSCADPELPPLIRSQRVRGIVEVEATGGTCLIRRDVLPRLSCDDGSGREDRVVLAHSASLAGIPQYLDNRRNYSATEAPEAQAPWPAEEARVHRFSITGFTAPPES